MSEGSDCFICADVKVSPILTNLCDCKDRKIHQICQERLMKECDTNAVCSVCNVPYRHVEFRRVRKKNFNYILWHTFALSLHFAFLASLFLTFCTIPVLSKTRSCSGDEYCESLFPPDVIALSLLTYAFFLFHKIARRKGDTFPSIEEKIEVRWQNVGADAV